MRRFKISGMTCSTCVKAIERAIWSTDKGALVRADLAKSEISVDTQVDSHSLIAAIRSAGFGVESAAT